MTARPAAILAIGDEIVHGETVDTNSPWIASRLDELGWSATSHRTVGDDRARLAQAIRDASADADVVIATGGLGPTDDDLTRFALGDLLAPGHDLLTDDVQRRAIMRWWAGRQAEMPEANLVQAMYPPGSSLIPNPRGTAPGIVVDDGSRLVFLLPGPPREMRGMFDEVVAPRLAGGAPPLACAFVRACGIGESQAAERLGEMMRRGRDPIVGTTASQGILTARVRSLDVDAVAGDAEAVERLWAPYVFGRGDDTLAGAVVGLLGARGETLATAESCTGGWVGKSVVDVAGSSAVYGGGWITYSNAMKIRELGVDPRMLDEFGAVSVPVARAMAIGALEHAGASFALSTTGVAGPDGGTVDKPVGRVLIGLARLTNDCVRSHVRVFRFRGDRQVIRQRTVLSALQMLRFSLLRGEALTDRLLWEVADEAMPWESGP